MSKKYPTYPTNYLPTEVLSFSITALDEKIQRIEEFLGGKGETLNKQQKDILGDLEEELLALSQAFSILCQYYDEVRSSEVYENTSPPLPSSSELLEKSRAYRKKYGL